MNIKKIGLSALAGSLVAFSANAAEMSVGSASIGVKILQTLLVKLGLWKSINFLWFW